MYDELNGSNKWNGSALGFMLLLGAAGAMVPVWLGVGQVDLEKSKDLADSHQYPRRQLNGQDDLVHIVSSLSSSDTDRNSERDEAEDTVGLRDHNSSSPGRMISSKDTSLLLLLLFLGLISNLTLLLSLLFWKLIPSIAMLGLYFAAWQCISAIFFTQLALSLKRVAVEASEQEVVANHPSRFDELNICKYCQRSRRQGQPSLYDNAIVGDEDKDIEFNVMNPLPQTVTTHTHPHRRYTGLSQARPPPPCSSSSSSAPCNDIRRSFALEESKESLSLSSPDRSIIFSEKIDRNDIDVMSDGICVNREGEGEDFDTSQRPVFVESLECSCPESTAKCEREGEREGGGGHKKDLDPSYSMGIVAVVAASGLLQILFLAVFFSSYAFSLRTAFSLLFLIYASSTCLYVVSTLWRNSIGVLSKEAWRLLMLFSCCKELSSR